MRPKRCNQGWLEFQPSHLQVTNEYYAKYESISETLAACPRILNLIHADVAETLDRVNKTARDLYRFSYTSDNVLRALLVQKIEGLPLRETIVRIDDSTYLRRFVRIGHGPMMDFTTLCRIRNKISAETWKSVNLALTRHAVTKGLIHGDLLRLDTTAVETNIHFPTDSSLMWDCWQVLARLIGQVREWAPELVGDRRLRRRDIRKHYLSIARKAVKKGQSAESLKPRYELLIGDIERVCDWAQDVRDSLHDLKGRRRAQLAALLGVEEYVVEFDHFLELTRRIVDQARRRVIDEEKVPNVDKLFSIFEEHTELLIRGKAGKAVEFGHMINIAQVSEKFISGYEVFDKKPIEHELVKPALERHKKLFGMYPDMLAGDRGYWKNAETLAQLEEHVDVVSIGRKGKRTEEALEREHSEEFRAGQRFRAGIEGTISFLKRSLGLARVMSKGWNHYAATVGTSIFAHNLLILARC